MNPRFLVQSALLLGACFAALAEEEAVPYLDPAPAAPSDSDYEALRKTSPFTRVLSLPETYALRGVATIGNTRVATLYNRETKKTIVVTPDGNNEAGISLVDIVQAPQLDGVTAKISFAGDEAELRYESSQLNPEPKGVPGAPGSGNRPPDGEHRGPSPQDIERFKALPEEKQAKLRDYIGHVMRSYPNMSRDERGNLIRGAMVRLTDGRDLEIPPAPQGQTGGGQPGTPGGPPAQGGAPPASNQIQIRTESRSGDSRGGDGRSSSNGDRGSSNGGGDRGGSRDGGDRR